VFGGLWSRWQGEGEGHDRCDRDKGVIAILLPAWVLTLAYRRVSLVAWAATGSVWLLAWAWVADWPVLAVLLALGLWLGGCAVFVHDGLRKAWVTAPIFKAFRRALPAMSQTEKEALEAGTVWGEGELFAGRPDWHRLLACPWPVLTPEEQAFLDDDTEALCRMIRDWDAVTHNDLSPEVWTFIRSRGFLGMIIPKAYGGKGFSAFAHSQVSIPRSSRGCPPVLRRPRSP